MLSCEVMTTLQRETCSHNAMPKSIAVRDIAQFLLRFVALWLVYGPFVVGMVSRTVYSDQMFRTSHYVRYMRGLEYFL